jgi:hypothetical protein
MERMLSPSSSTASPPFAGFFCLGARYLGDVTGRSFDPEGAVPGELSTTFFGSCKRFKPFVVEAEEGQAIARVWRRISTDDPARPRKGIDRTLRPQPSGIDLREDLLQEGLSRNIGAP